jgi:hypothetical protein
MHLYFQPQQDSNQWAGANAGYYGYGQGYEAYGYPQSQDPNAYGYGAGAYAGYPNYQQQPVAQQPQQQQVRFFLLVDLILELRAGMPFAYILHNS